MAGDHTCICSNGILNWGLFAGRTCFQLVVVVAGGGGGGGGWVDGAYY